MLIPAYITAVGKDGKPFAFAQTHPPARGQAFPEAPEINARYELGASDAQHDLRDIPEFLERLVLTRSAPTYRFATKLQVWNATVREFKAERALMGDVKVAAEFAEWRRIRWALGNSVSSLRSDPLNDLPEDDARKIISAGYAFMSTEEIVEIRRRLVFRPIVAKIEAVIRKHELNATGGAAS